MKLYAALCATALLSGCITSNEDQSSHKKQDTQSVEQSYALCKSAVDSTPEALRIAEFLILGQKWDANDLKKTTNKSFATDRQIADIQKYHERLEICRDKAIDELQAINESYATLVKDYFKTDDKITADLVNKKITIEEANREVTKSAYYYALKSYDLMEVTGIQ